MSAAASAIRKPVIGVIFYSTYGHVATLAEEVIKGVEAAGAIAKPYQIQETLPAEVLQKMHAGGSLKPKYPIIDALTKPEELKELDGFLLGAPTRYGRLPAQVSAFFDTTGQLWASGALAGKFASTFTSTASQHGGQETTHLTTIPFFAHHGIIYVPIGYTQPYLTDLTDVHGGSAYGVSTVAAADGSRSPTSGELQLAKYQGEYFSKIVGQFVAGKQRLAGGAIGGPQTQNIASTGQQGQTGQTGATGAQGQQGHGAGTAAAVGAGAGAAGAGGAYLATRGVNSQGDREQTFTSVSAETPGAYNETDYIGGQQPGQGQQGQGYAVGGRPDETSRQTGAGTGAGAAGTTGHPSTTGQTGTNGATGQTGTGHTGAGAAAAGAATGAGAAAVAGHGQGQEGTKPSAHKEVPDAVVAQETIVAEGTPTATGTLAGGAGAKPPQAQQKKKKGGLFSCCSTSNID